MINKLIIWWESLKFWFDWSECDKEKAGYRCQHRTMSNGTKECGEETNYWRGNNE